MKFIPVAKPKIVKKDIDSVNRSLKSGWITSGPETKSFEQLVSDKLKIKNVIAVNSATSGIIASIIARGFSPGDEVITPANTFISTIHSLHNLKLKVKLCDIDINTLSTNENFFLQRINKKTKFFIPVHFGGNPINIKKLIDISIKKKIFLIDDAATCLGAKIDNKFLGSHKKNITVFSLHANKILTSGEGGLICTSDNKLATKLRYIINSGLSTSSWERYQLKGLKIVDSILPGYKFNYNDILASLAKEQFKRLNKIIFERKQIYLRYNKNLFDLINNNKIYLPKINSNSESSYYCFQIMLKEGNKRIRDKLSIYLKNNNISTTVYYTPANEHTFYKKKFKNQGKYLKNSNYVFERSLALPMFNGLKNNDIDKICEFVIKFFKHG
jgi:dTDP-4-amino-4,6-dideoxygalactose transaminase